MKGFYLILLSTLFLAIASCQNTDEVTLSLNLEKGKTYYQNINSKINTIQNMNGQEINLLIELNSKMSYLVKDIQDSIYHLEVSYEKMVMDMQYPQGKISYSSEKNDKEDVFSNLLAKMKGNPFLITMDHKGKILDVQNIDQLFESLFSDYPDLGEDQKQQIKVQLMDSYGEEAFKGNMEMVTSIFPDKSVKKGDTWTTSLNLNTGFASDVQTTYTFLGKKGGDYKIHGESEMKTSENEDYIENNGLEMKYDLKGNMVSDIVLNGKTGWIEEAKISQDIQGNSTIKANPQMPDGMTIPMVMKNEMTISGK